MNLWCEGIFGTHPTANGLAVVTIVVSVFFCVMPAGADPPVQGTYHSYDSENGGSFHPGGFSESWVSSDGMGQVGNTFHLESWDGMDLGDEWRIWCNSIQQPPVINYDTRDVNGTGIVDWRWYGGGGRIWLSQRGPWGNNTEGYTGDMAFFIVIAVHYYVNWVIEEVELEFVTFGYIDDHPNVFEFEIASGLVLGNTLENGVKPNDYPGFMDGSCAMNASLNGSWGVSGMCRLIIYDDVPTAPSTWGKIKSRYRE